jgi:hypothetical protein
MNQRNKGKLAVKLRRYKAVMKKNKAEPAGPAFAAAKAKHQELQAPPAKGGSPR